MFELIIALGNPGIQYELTRHNVAWLAIDAHPQWRDLAWKDKFKGLWATANIKSQEVKFLKPQTYMNLSGESVKAMLSFYKIPVEKILVIHDEVDFELGRMAYKIGGGLAGHNGLKSIVQHLGTQNFSRVRIGIGRPTHGDLSSWVLGRFTQEELLVLENTFNHLYKALALTVNGNVENALNHFNYKGSL